MEELFAYLYIEGHDPVKIGELLMQGEKGDIY